MRYRFGEFQLDTESCALSRAGASVHVWPKVFDVLRYLVEHPSRLVSKQELLEALWADAHVDEVAVPWAISHARRILGQRSGEKAPIETVHGRGYRFVADVQVVAMQTTPPMAAAAREATDAAAPFVGRDDVMQQLLARLEEAKQGRGGFCVLAGVAGIGKTRCMDELSLRAKADGFSVWSGRSVEDAWAPVFWPWVQVVRDATRERRDLAQTGEALLTRLASMERAGGDAGESGPAQDDTFWWVSGVSNLLLDAARERPVLLLLDDVQWADAASIDLLAFIAPDLRRASVLVVATQRSGAEGLHEKGLKRLSRHAERIELTPLSERDVAQYILGVGRAAAPSTELCASVHGATAGNPLFLEQTVRTLVARHGQSALASLSPDAVEPPLVARDVLGAALQVLDPDTRDLLALASVLGETFEVATLQQLGGRPVEDLLAALDEACRAGFLIAEEPVAFSFCHALLRSVLYDGLPVGFRTTRHRRVAEILERASGTPRHGEVAHHYYASLALGEHERVTEAATRAARAAARLHAFADAARFCEWACNAQALERDVAPRARAELLLFSANIQSNAGQDERARQTVEALVAIARPHGYHDLLVRAARILRPFHLMGALEDPAALAMLEEALRHAPSGPNDLRISALSQLAWLPPYALDIRRSKELSGEALDLARELREESSLLRAQNARLYALSGPEDTSEVLAVATEMDAANRSQNGWACAATFGARYGALLYRGEMSAADALRVEFGNLARMRQWPTAVWYHDRLALQRDFQNGDFEKVTAALPGLRELGQRLRIWYARNLTDITQALLLIELQGLRTLQASMDTSVVRDQFSAAPLGMRPSLSRLLAELGDHGFAKKLLDTLAADGFASVPKELSYLNALSNLSIIAIAVNDHTRAQMLYELLVPFEHYNTPNVLLFYEGSVSHFLGLLAAFLGRQAAVERHFDDALAMNERLGQRPQLARTCYEYARWLQQRGAKHARASGRDLRARGLSLTQAMGMAPLATRLEALEPPR